MGDPSARERPRPPTSGRRRVVYFGRARARPAAGRGAVLTYGDDPRRRDREGIGRKTSPSLEHRPYLLARHQANRPPLVGLYLPDGNRPVLALERDAVCPHPDDELGIFDDLIRLVVVSPHDERRRLDGHTHR